MAWALQLPLLLLLAGVGYGAAQEEDVLRQFSWSTAGCPAGFGGGCGVLVFCQSSPGKYGYRMEGEAVCLSPGPLIRMEGGKRYRMTLRNEVAGAVTNLHTHGLHISGSGNADDVTRRVEYGGCLDYAWDIPSDHYGGTFWYHAHRHGTVQQQVAGGAHGMLVVEDWGTARLQAPAEAGLFLGNEKAIFVSNAGGVGGSVGWHGNGRAGGARVTVHPGVWYRFRLATSHPDLPRAEYRVGGGGCKARAVARDGVLLRQVPGGEATSFKGVNGASRLDLAVWCSVGGGGGTLSVVDAQGQEGVVAVIQEAAGGGAGPSAEQTQASPFGEAGNEASTWTPARPGYLQSVLGETVAAGNRFEVRLGATSINENAFDPSVPLKGDVAYGTVQEWTIRGEAHPFHLHLYHFQVVGACGDYAAGEWYDTLTPVATTGCTVRFRTADVGQRCVLHCHILGHEDRGAMGWVNVVGAGVPEQPTEDPPVGEQQCFVTERNYAPVAVGGFALPGRGGRPREVWEQRGLVDFSSTALSRRVDLQGEMFEDGFAFDADVWLPDVATTPWWRIFDFGRGEAQDNVHLAFRADTRRLTLEVFGDGVNLWILDDPNVFPVLTWVRVGVSIVPIGDGDGLAVLYTNGEEVARGVGPYPNAVERGSSFVGRSNWAVDQDFGGKMASIRVWSGAPPEGTTSPSVAPIGVPPVLQSPGTTTFAAGGPSEAAVLGTVGGGGGYVFEGEVRADEVTAGTLLEVWDATTNTGARLRLAPSGRLSFVPLQGSSQEEAGGEGIEIESRRPLPSGWATVGAVVRPLSATGPDAGRAVAVLYVDGNEEGRASHANWLPGKGMTAKLGGGGFRGTVASPRMWDETPKNSVPLASSPSNEQLSLDGTSRYLDLGALDLGLEFAVEGEVMLDEHRGWARIFDCGTEAVAQDNVWLGVSPPTMALALEVWNSGVARKIVDPTPLPVGRWVRVAAAVRALPGSALGLAVLFRDGVEVGRGEMLLPRDIKRARCYLGRSNWEADPLLKGGLRSVKVWGGGAPPPFPAAQAGPGARAFHVGPTTFDGTARDVVDLGVQRPFGARFAFEGEVLVDAQATPWTRIFDFGDTNEQGIGVDSIWSGITPDGKLRLETLNGLDKRAIEDPEDFPRGVWVRVGVVIQSNGAEENGRALATAALFRDGAEVARDDVYFRDVVRPRCFLGGSNWAADPYLRGGLRLVEVWGDGRSGVVTELGDWDLVAVHMAVLPDGKVLGFGSPRKSLRDIVQMGSDAWVWTPDPDATALPTGEPQYYNGLFKVDTFCSSTYYSVVHDRLVVVGGNAHGTDIAATFDNYRPGVKKTVFFDHTAGANQAMEEADLQSDRWYSTLVGLPDGRVLSIGGSAAYRFEAFKGNANTGISSTPEVLGSDKRWTLLHGATSVEAFGYVDNRWWYPRAYVAPDGKVFGVSGDLVWVMDPDAAGAGGAGSIEVVPGAKLPTFAGVSCSSVLFARGKMVVIGGGQRSDGDPRPATNKVYVVDYNNGSPTVSAAADMAERRNWVNAVVLPTGEVAAIGGTRFGNYADQWVSTIELWNPPADGTTGPGVWTTDESARILVERNYHSTAVLLPDARVLIAGSGIPVGANGGEERTTTEVYEPPYLFTEGRSRAGYAPRPTIQLESGADTVGYGKSFQVKVTNGHRIADVTIISLPAVTHGVNNGQRFLRLEFNHPEVSDIVTITIPNNRRLLPPGYYMVYLLNPQGVPSKAVRVGEDLIRLDP